MTAGPRALFRGLHAGGYTFKRLIAGVQALGSSSLQRRARGRSIVLSLQVQSPRYLLQGQRLPAPAALQMVHKCACTLPSIYTPCKPCADVPLTHRAAGSPWQARQSPPHPQEMLRSRGASTPGLNLRLPSHQTLSSSMELESTVVQLSSVQLSPNPTR